MEELQDALEDAQYVNAINLDEGPRPITAWDKPSEEAMQAWKIKLVKTWRHRIKLKQRKAAGYGNGVDVSKNSGGEGEDSLNIDMKKTTENTVYCSEEKQDSDRNLDTSTGNSLDDAGPAGNGNVRSSGGSRSKTSNDGSASTRASERRSAANCFGIGGGNAAVVTNPSLHSKANLNLDSNSKSNNKNAKIDSNPPIIHVPMASGSGTGNGMKAVNQQYISAMSNNTRSKPNSNLMTLNSNISCGNNVSGSYSTKYTNVVSLSDADNVDGYLPEPFTYEWVMATSLGFFLFSAFVKRAAEKENNNDHVQFNFIEEMLRLRYLRGRSRGYKLKRIYKRYLSPCAIDPETKEIKFPPVSNIDECDLEYSPHGEKMSAEELAKHMRENVLPSPQKNKGCVLGIHGPLMKELIEKLESQVSTGNTVYTDDYGGTIDDFSMQTDDASSTNDYVGNNAMNTVLGETDATFKSLRSRALCKAPDDIFDTLEQVIVECIRVKHWEAFRKSSDYTKLLDYLWHRDEKVTDEHFFLMRVLGRGGFGLVTACKKGTTGTLYAMKVMNKKRIKAKKSERLALNERACLAAVDSPFVVNLKYSFQTKDELYLILDLMTGGDLSFHLSQIGRFPLDQCLYYAARIMLGLQALHDQNYVYRDLKPENLLLAEDGRVRITDLGLATQVTHRLHGVAGTRGYWAPEMLRRNEKGKRMRYDQRVDWFSYGCVVAEMICGCNPFRSETALKFGLRMTETKEKALDHATLHMDPSFESKKFDVASTDLCKRLLDKDPDVRLGANGCEEIMGHPWFKDTNWELIQSDREKPPFVPLKDINAASQSEIGVFADNRNAPKLADDDHNVYADWDWASPRAFSAEVIDMLIYERETGRPLVPLTVSGTCCCALM